MKYEFTKTPCKDGQAWLDSQPDSKTAWKTCDRGDWMWWALRCSKKSQPSKETSVKFANWCARRAKEYSAAAAAVSAFSDICCCCCCCC